MKHKKVTWLELFFDLVFVTAVSSTTHLLLSVDCHPDKTAIYFVEYLLMVIPMFWCWVGQTMFVNRFGGEKKNLELYMIPQMFFAILLTASFHSAFSDAYYTFLIGYLGIRFIIIIQYFTMSRSLVNAPRKVALLLGNIFLLGFLTTGASFFFDGTLRYFFVYLGIVVDMVIPPFYINTLRKVPVDFYHLAERFGLFVIITFGESFLLLPLFYLVILLILTQLCMLSLALSLFGHFGPPISVAMINLLTLINRHMGNALFMGIS